MFNKKAQGSLEYLVIIAVVLLVAGVVVYLVTGSAGSSKQNILISNCQAAAEQCKLLKAANPNTVCSSCDTQCIDSASGEEIFPGAIGCCKAGNSSGIFEGSTGCVGGPVQTCSDDAQCDDSNVCTVDSCVSGYCSYSNDDGATCADDGNNCTLDVCSGGSCTHPAVADGNSCDNGNGECQSGVCVAYSCSVDGDCDDSNNCTVDSCVGGYCSYENVADGTSCDSGTGECSAGTCVHCIDSDGDGYGVNGGSDCQYSGVDCDDSNPDVNPGASEVCGNGVDDDCNGLVDSDDPACPSWHIETAVSSGAEGYTSLVLDPEGAPKISYYSSYGDLYFVSKSDYGWTSTKITDGDDCGRYSSITYESGNLKIVYLNDTGNQEFLYASQMDDYGAWNSQVLFSPSYTNNRLTSIYADGNFVLFFSSDYTLNKLYVKSAVTEDVDSYSCSTYFFGSIVSDINGLPLVSYYDCSSGDLKFAYKSSGNWVTQTIDSVGDVGKYSSIALDSNGYPHIAYYDSDDGDLKYAWFDGSVWNKVVLDGSTGNDTNGNVGEYVSLKIDSKDYSHISYFDDTDNVLKYAYEDDEGWHFETIDDSSSDVGEYTDLELDSSDFPHIVYYDALNSAVKYAWFGYGN